ncbi:MAG: anti-sigma factor [Rhodobacteraceae bacterium]|nr:anti-sigma factor [Paracoccaceae bacterium]
MSEAITPDPRAPRDPDDLLAAEYVLGVLPASERQAVADRAELDGALQARIADWEVRLAVLNAAYDEGPVPADLYPRIEAALFGDAAGSSVPERAPIRRGFGWLWAGATLIAAALAMVLLFWPQLQPATPTLIARLDAGATVFDARFDGRDLRVERTGAVAANGSDYELWAIGADGIPRSLGLLRADHEALATGELEEGVTLAVSVEPFGGAPGGAPTGPVIAAAPLTRSL